MKRLVMFNLVLLVSLSFVFASVSVHDYDVATEYTLGEYITGFINLTIKGVDYDALLESNFGNSRKIGEVLEDAGADNFCSTQDCSLTYSKSNGQTIKNISVKQGVETYVGFYLKGEDVSVDGINFDLASDFGKETSSPLSMQFFENTQWNFLDFSGEYSENLSKNYDRYSAKVGSRITSSTSYCELVSFYQTQTARVFVDLNGTDDATIIVEAFTTSGSSMGDCEFDPNDEVCLIESDFEEEDYYFCVSSDESTNYYIKEDTTGKSSGATFNDVVFTNKSKDYGIIVQAELYSSADEGIDVFNYDDLILGEMIADANEILEERYGNDCSDGCILPIKIEGIDQYLIISNIGLDYIADGDALTETKLYDLDSDFPTVNFSGSLDLAELNFVAKEGDFELTLDDDELIEEEFTILEAPSIYGIYPMEVPAGVPILFYMSVSSENESILTYSWDFDDDSLAQSSTENVLEHTYAEVGNYTIKVGFVSSDGAKVNKSFSIDVVSPDDIIEETILYKKSLLRKVLQDINSLPYWLQEDLKKSVNYTYYESELSAIEKSYAASFTDDEKIEVAQNLFALNFPMKVYTYESYSAPLTSTKEDIDPLAIQEYAGGSSGNASDYVDSILYWQTNNVLGTIGVLKIGVSYQNNDADILMTVYSPNFQSIAYDDAYIVINKQNYDMTFKEAPVLKKGNDKTIIELLSESNVAFEFYVNGDEDLAFFVSPALNKLPTEFKLEACNYNNVCEKSEGENSSNCRNDCKPIGMMIFWIILVFFFGLIAYTFLQVWYQKRYETFLFKDRRYLYNLMMFILNARNRETSVDEIKKMLLSKGWTTEQVDYAIKKAHGERTGLYELVPVDWILSKLGMFNGSGKVITEVPQQTAPKVNKPLMRR